MKHVKLYEQFAGASDVKNLPPVMSINKFLRGQNEILKTWILLDNGGPNVQNITIEEFYARLRTGKFGGRPTVGVYTGPIANDNIITTLSDRFNLATIKGYNLDELINKLHSDEGREISLNLVKLD